MMSRTFEKGKEAGIKLAKKEYELTYPCSECKEQISIAPGGKSHKAVIAALKGWGHASCINK